MEKKLFSIPLVIFLIIISYSPTESFGSSGPVIPMQDSVASYGATTNSANQVQSEFVSSTSSLVGKSIDTIVVDLKKSGSPTGTAQVGVFNSNLSVKQLFGTKDTSSLTSSLTQYSFSLPVNQTYTIQSGDRIGIKFTGGSSSNYVDAGIDQTNSFDGTNSYLSYYATSWQASTGKDLTMTLKSNVSSSGPTISALPPAGTYNSAQSVTLTASVPSTIFYTSDGSTPTTSSTNHASPLSLNVNNNSTLKFFAKDTLGNLGPVGSSQYIIKVTATNDSVASYGTTYAGVPIQAEFATSSSSLVGKSIDNIIVDLKKIGSPTGTVQVGTFNTDRSVKQLFGTKDASSLTQSFSQYFFSLPSTQTYKIQSGDRIGIKFTGGSSSNFVRIMVNQTNSFDGTNSYLTNYTTSWQTSTGKDLTLVLGLGTSSSGILVKPPMDILSVTTNSSRNIPNLGTPTVTDKNDPNPVITNNSPGKFPLGVTTVTWRATDSKGHVGQAQQKITVISASPPANQFNRLAMINFDDDFESEYTLGKPILDKYNIKVTLYTICGKVNEADYMTWNMIHSMQSDGQDIQAHTMNHLNSNLLSQKQLDYEYGKDIACLKNNGTAGVHVVAMPFNDGFDNPKVINTIAKYFDFARGINFENPHSFFLHCNDPSAKETNCKTYNSSGHLNLFNRYTIPAWSNDLSLTSDNFNDAQTLSQFVKQVNKASTNTNSITTEIPIVYYHRVVLDNAAISNVSHKGTSTMLLDAEMKYLVDNNFKIRTTKDLGYDTTKNWFFFKTH